MPERYYVDRHGDGMAPSAGIAGILFRGPDADGHFFMWFGSTDLGDQVKLPNGTMRTKADAARCVRYLRLDWSALTDEWRKDGRDPKDAWIVKLAARLAAMNQ